MASSDTSLWDIIIDMLNSLLPDNTWESSGMKWIENQHKAGEQRAQLLAAADILVLAAVHDHVVTEREHRCLGEEIAALLASHELLEGRAPEALVDELVQRWLAWRPGASDRELRDQVRDRAVWLDRDDRQRVLAAVRRIVEAPKSSGPTGYRSAAPRDDPQTAVVFARALGL